MRRSVAMAAIAGAASLLGGCSVLVSLDGLVAGGCDGACVDANASVDPPALDSGSAVLPAADAGAFDSGGSPGLPDAAEGRDATVPLDGTAPADAAHPTDTGAPADAAPPPPEAACTPLPPPSLDDCTGLGSLAAPPVIDGVLECGVPVWPMPIVATVGPGPIPSTVQASIGAAWRPDGLYLWVNVTGAGATRTPPPAGAGLWCGDAVELFVDNDGTYANAPSYDSPGTIQVILASPPTTAPSATVGEMFRGMADLGPWTGEFLTVRTSDGFAAEAFLVASDLGLGSWALASGGHVGLDVAVDLGASSQPASCPRLGQFTIQLPDGTGGGCFAACDVNEFCVPKLH